MMINRVCLGIRMRHIQSSAFFSCRTVTTNFSNKSGTDETKIHVVGGKDYDDMKQIRLVQLPTIATEPKTLASVYVKRNIIFGSRVHVGGFGLVKTCLPLLKRALAEAGVEGDQPQGVATLNGLSNYVRHAIENPNFSKAMEKLKLLSNEEDGAIALEAVKSVATQIPRQGHSVVGVGTYTDARDGWTALAKEYATRRRGQGGEGVENAEDGESQLFAKVGATFVNVEYIGDENPQYWADAGGAMARFFFL